MVRRGSGRIAAVVVAACVVSLVSGCTLLSPAHRARAASDVPAPGTVPIAQQLPNLLVAGQTIGRGALRVIDHEPIPDAVAQHPLTGAVTIVVAPDRHIDVRIRPDDAARADLAGIDLMMSGKRYDGRPENIQDQDRYPLISGATSTAPDGELVLPLEADIASLADPTFLHSIEESPAGDARVMAAAAITWTLPSSFPDLKAVDSGAVTNAHGRTVVENGTPAYYIPHPADTIFTVSSRFGLTEAQLVWLNPELLGDTADPELKAGIGVNLDPARR